jgi:SulP family sulfate permease
MLQRLSSRYGWSAFAGDASGGAIAALIALPYGLAMATMMGLPPVLGIVTSITAGPLTALLGRNPVLIGGTASATVPFIAHAVSAQGLGGAAKVCLVASVAMMAFCVLGLGRYIQKVPHPVVTGFSCGVGAMMVLSQLKPMLGVTAVVDRGSSNLLFQTWEVLRSIGTARLAPIAISLVVVGVACVAARKSHRLPAPLLGVVAALVVARLFSLNEREVGATPLRFPAFAGFSWTAEDISTVLPAGLALAFVASVNLLLTSRVVEHFQGRHRPLTAVDADRELGAYGIANIAAAMFGAPLSVGIPARSLANVRCGATTRISNLLHAVMIMALVGIGGAWIARIPIAALAAVTAWVGGALLEWGVWRRLPLMRRIDAVAFLATAVAVLVVNAVAAVGIGCLPYAIDWCYSRARRIPWQSLRLGFRAVVLARHSR